MVVDWVVGCGDDRRRLFPCCVDIDFEYCTEYWYTRVLVAAAAATAASVRRTMAWTAAVAMFSPR